MVTVKHIPVRLIIQKPIQTLRLQFGLQKKKHPYFMPHKIIVILHISICPTAGSEYRDKACINCSCGEQEVRDLINNLFPQLDKGHAG